MSPKASRSRGPRLIAGDQYIQVAVTEYFPLVFGLLTSLKQNESGIAEAMCERKGGFRYAALRGLRMTRGGWAIISYCLPERGFLIGGVRRGVRGGAKTIRRPTSGPKIVASGECVEIRNPSASRRSNVWKVESSAGAK